MQIFEDSEKSKELTNYRLPRYDELLDIDLFMNQLIDVLNGRLSVFLVPDEAKVLTASMINNYVYNHVIQAPKQKKYTKIHIIHLLSIGILKQVLPISDVAELIRKQLDQYPINIAYDYFCEEVEKALKVVFGNRSFAEIDKTQPRTNTPLAKKVRSAAVAFANKIYVKQSIYFENNNK